MFEQKIPCPDCNTSIPFDTQQLIAGVQFKCPNCDVSIGLASESKSVVEDTMDKFQELKRSVGK